MLVSLDAALPEIIEKSSSLSYKLQEPSTGMVIFRMGLEVLGEILDALTQQRNLHFRGAGIALMKSELLYYPFFLLLSTPHDLRFVSLSFFTDRISSTVIL
jgi:hypothetical protein